MYVVPETQVDNARASIARLERDLSGLQVDHDRIKALDHENELLLADLADAQTVSSALEEARDHAIQDRDQLRDRVAGLISFIQPGQVMEPLSPSLKATSATAKRASKRLRGSSSSGSVSPPRSRPRQRSPKRAPKSITVPTSRGGSASRSPFPSGSSSSKASRLGGGSRSRSQQQPQSGRDSSPSSEDDSLLAALASSRSSNRRRTSSASSPSGRSPSRPIDIGSPSSSEVSDQGPGQLGGLGGDARDASSDNEGDDGDDSSSNVQHDSGQGNGDNGGSDGSVSDQPRTHRDHLLTQAALDRLDHTTVPRDVWIPGYRDRVRRAAADVSPWSASTLGRVSALEMDIDLLFHRLAKPKNWIFPPQSQSPRRGTWSPDLITETNIVALYATAPWNSLNAPVTPVSFDVADWFEVMSRKYLEIEDDHRQALWETTHAFMISSKLRKSSAYLARLWEYRRQRRSRLSAVWKRFLKLILQGMIAGHCDLDILLDPFFLHYPRAHEQRVWYPGIGCNPPPSNLADALRAIDLAEPWRNQYRGHLQDHSGSQLPRSAGKFSPVTGQD